jgi:ABC-type nitrate/sulfonate/bicarbonate transport system permease component
LVAKQTGGIEPDANSHRTSDVRRRATAMRWRWEKALPIVIWSLSIAAFVLFWQLASSFYTPAVLPSPGRTLKALLDNLQSGLLLRNAAASLGRVITGFAIGAMIGVALGLAAGRVRLARLALDPYVNFLRFVPAIALLTPFVVWFGIGEASKILLIVFATLFIVLLNTIAGVDDIPRNRLRAAGMLGAGAWHTFALVVVPSALPYMITGMRIAMGVSFASIIVAEMVSADRGLGYLMSYAMVISATDLQFVTIACLGVLGWGTDKSFQILTRLALGRFSGDSLTSEPVGGGPV